MLFALIYIFICFIPVPKMKVVTFFLKVNDFKFYVTSEGKIQILCEQILKRLKNTRVPFNSVKC